MERYKFYKVRPPKPYYFLAGGVLIALGAGAYAILHQSQQDTAPTYTTILPENHAITDLGGWQRISPPEKDPVFAYSDTLKGVAISVSQQPLPESFAADTGTHIRQLAESYNATTQIDANGTTVYIGRSARGPESVIFTKDGLLVLIKSQGPVDQKIWAQYVAQLVNPRTNRTPTF